MPYKTYLDSHTNKHIQAICCGHDGELMIERLPFKEGEFIVEFPDSREVFSEKDFQERFNKGNSTIDWKAMGWG